MSRTLGTLLLAAGALVCVLGALGLAVGMFVSIPREIARALVRAAGFSAPFVVGGALMVAGAALRRAARQAVPPSGSAGRLH